MNPNYVFFLLLIIHINNCTYVDSLIVLYIATGTSSTLATTTPSINTQIDSDGKL